jgi:hypothetical protein
MNDIKTLLDRASSAPLLAFDADEVVARGRARLRRRRVGLAGGVAVGVAAAVAAGLALTSTVGPTHQIGGPPSGPRYTLPDLDPGVHYYWHSQGRANDATAAQLSEAVVDYLAANLATAKVVAYGPDFEDDGATYRRRLVSPGSPDSPLRLSRYTNELVTLSDPGSAAAYVEPVYRLWESGTPRAEDDSVSTLDQLSGAELALDGSGQDQIDLLRVALFPAGGYRSGVDPAKMGARRPSDGYLVEGCETYDVTDAHKGTADDRRFSFDCVESTGSRGERVVAVAAHETYLRGGARFTLHTVVVYRTDGTAVVVSDTPRPGLDWEQGGGRVPGAPGLSLDDLTDLALALPLVTIP